MFSISLSALLRYARSLSGGSSKQSAAKHKTSYSFSFEVTFVYFKTSETVLQAGLYKARLLGGLAS